MHEKCKMSRFWEKNDKIQIQNLHGRRMFN
jgi:hypothetical protein